MNEDSPAWKQCIVCPNHINSISTCIPAHITNQTVAAWLSGILLTLPMVKLGFLANWLKHILEYWENTRSLSTVRLYNDHIACGKWRWQTLADGRNYSLFMPPFSAVNVNTLQLHLINKTTLPTVVCQCATSKRMPIATRVRLWAELGCSVIFCIIIRVAR